MDCCEQDSSSIQYVPQLDMVFCTYLLVLTNHYSMTGSVEIFIAELTNGSDCKIFIL
jgi:hypothetical protein